MSNKVYRIHKKILYTDIENIYPFIKFGVFFYIIEDVRHGVRYLYVTNRELVDNYQLIDKELSSIKVNFKEKVYLKKDKDILKREFFKVILEMGRVSFVPYEVSHIVKNNRNNEPYYYNKFKINKEYIFFDNPDWFIAEIKSLKIRKISKKVMKEILKDAKIDERIKKVMITLLFNLNSNKYQYFNTHSIILTNGGVGKSSVLGIIGKRLDNTSNSGIYGYYSTNNNTWIGGVVSQTRDAIIIDEINELVRKTSSNSDNILTNINTPLEDGRFRYGKAGGREINFANKFVFMGNIGFDFNFESFLIAVITNNETAGRRFAYIIYDDKLKPVQGVERRPKEKSSFVVLIQRYLSYLFDYYIEVRNFHSRLLKNKQLQKLENKYKAELLSMLNANAEDIGENTYKFMNYFIKESLKLRTKVMALKLALFWLIDELAKTDVKKYRLSSVMDRTIVEYQGLLEDIKIALKNIIEHKINNQINNSNNSLNKKRFDSLNKTCKNLLISIYQDGLYNEKFFYFKDFGFKKGDKRRFLKYDILNNKKINIVKLNRILINFGVSIEPTNPDIKIIISNKELFLSYEDCYKDYLRTENLDASSSDSNTGIEILDIQDEDL